MLLRLLGGKSGLFWFIACRVLRKGWCWWLVGLGLGWGILIPVCGFRAIRQTHARVLWAWWLYGILGAFLLACADGWVFAEKTGSEDRGKVLLSYSAFE
jgi:hypothetical protein